jgi:hypothetical protein
VNGILWKSSKQDLCLMAQRLRYINYCAARDLGVLLSYISVERILFRNFTTYFTHRHILVWLHEVYSRWDFLIVTGAILLSLSLFGKDTSSSSKHSTGAKSTSSSEESSLVLTHVKTIGEDEPILSPTSSMEMSDYSTEVSNLVDVPSSPNRRVCDLLFPAVVKCFILIRRP